MNVNVNTWKWCSVSSGTELLKRIFLYAQWWNFWLHAAYTDNTLLYIRYTGYSTWFVNCIIVPWLLLFSLCRMKPWWGPCSCLRTWCRTKRRWRRQRHGGKKWESLVWVRVCECGWMHMCNTSDLSSSSRSVSSSWFWVERPPPPTHGDLNEGIWTGNALHTLSLLQRFLRMNTKWPMWPTWTHHSRSCLEDLAC